MANETLCYTTVLRNPCKGENNQNIALWQFLLDLLVSKKQEHLIKWTGDCPGEFKFVDAEGVAKLWGEKRNKPRMNYDKMSRALRYYYIRGFLVKVEGKKFVYKFLDVPDAYKAHVFGNKKVKEEATDFFGENEIVSQPYAYKDINIKSENLLPNKSNTNYEFLNQNAYQMFVNDNNNSFIQCSLQTLTNGEYALVPNRPISLINQSTNKQSVEASFNVPKDQYFQPSYLGSSKMEDLAFSDLGKDFFFLPNDCFKDILLQNDLDHPQILQKTFNNIDLSNIKLIPSDFNNSSLSENDFHFFSPNLTLPSFITSAFITSLSSDKDIDGITDKHNDELITPVISDDKMDLATGTSTIESTLEFNNKNNPKVKIQRSSMDVSMDISDDDSCFLGCDKDEAAKVFINTNQDELVASSNTAGISIASSDEQSQETFRISSASRNHIKLRPMPLHLSNIAFQKVSSGTNLVVNSEQKVLTPMSRIHFWSTFSPLMPNMSPRVSVSSPSFKFPIGIFASPRILFSGNAEVNSDSLKTPK